MTWLAQVRHVFWKDLRQTRWSIAAYVLVTLVATYHALGQPGDLANAVTGSGAASGLVMLLGIIVVASVVQADSPTRSNAFWASRPFYSSAVLSAKFVLGAVVVVGLPLIGESVVLTSFAVAPASQAAVAEHSVFLYAGWLLTAALVAALTMDLRSFAVAYVAVAIVAVGGGVAALPHIWTPLVAHARLFRGLGALIGIVGGVALLAYLYRRRDVRWTAWVAVVPVVACALGAGITNPASPGKDAGPSVVRAGIHVALVDYDEIGARQELQLQVTVDSGAGGTSSDQFLLATERFTVHLRDGTAFQATPLAPVATVRTAPLPVKAGTKWVGESTDLQYTTNVAALLTNDQRRMLTRGIASVDLDGRLSVLRPRDFADLPFAGGQSLQMPGWRARFVNVNHSADAASLEMRTVSVADPGTRAAVGHRVSLALVNDTAREAMVFQNTNNGSSSDWLVLPGTAMYEETSQLETNARRLPRADMIRDDAWYRGAHITVFNWISAGSYPVHATIVVP